MIHVRKLPLRPHSRTGKTSRGGRTAGALELGRALEATEATEVTEVTAPPGVATGIAVRAAKPRHQIIATTLKDT